MKIELDQKEVQEMVTESINKCVQGCIERERDSIRSSMRSILEKELFGGNSQLENQLHWSIESAINQAMAELVEEVGLKDIIKQEMISITQDSDVMKELALQKIRANFDLD